MMDDGHILKQKLKFGKLPGEVINRRLHGPRPVK
jgi:hypothetical protein